MLQSAQPEAAVTPATWYVVAMERLVGAVQQLSQAQDLNAIAAVVREAARELTGADGATFVLRDGDQCYYADENAIGPLWKGKRFPIDACISGWVMRNGRPAIIEDIYGDTRISVDAYRSTFVKSLAMVPIRRDAPIGAIGNYWAKRHIPTGDELFMLQTLADAAAAALQNVERYGKLKEHVRALEERAPPRDGRREAPLANVLLVDDAEDYLDLAKAILFEASGLKCHLTTARDGKQALDIIRRNAGTPDGIDFILLDINMPDMDGFAFMEQLHRHEQLKNLAVVMCTGSADDNDRRRADALGAAGYLVKPASWERLQPIVENIKAVKFQPNSEGGRLLRAG